MEYVKELHELCEIVAYNIQELTEYLKKNDGCIEPEDAEYLDLLTHTAKSLIMVKKEAMESGEDYGSRYMNSGYGRRYSEGEGYGRYSDDGYGRRMRSSRTGRYMENRYRDDGRDMVKDHLRAAIDAAPDEDTKRALQDAMRKFE